MPQIGTNKNYNSPPQKVTLHTSPMTEKNKIKIISLNMQSTCFLLKWLCQVENGKLSPQPHRSA